MKYFLLSIFILLTPLMCFGYDYDYEVSGADESGNFVYGDVEVDQYGGDGYIYTEDGEGRHIDVDWTGYGELDGYDEEGNYYQLEVD